MIVEQRTYTIKPGTTQEYLKTYQEQGMEAQLEILGNMVGYFYTEIGPLNQIIHMWGYDSFEERTKRRTALFQDPRWQKMLPNLRQHLVSQESKILMPTSFSPIR